MIQNTFPTLDTVEVDSLTGVHMGKCGS